ncbi:helix-hairpin-helix domain-containing protein [Gracilibacillus sp. S3-1-1]|uniref:Helix-hairpin-helix domain-containing protein n=1 Tax=Gracilibacillus pellucidus TaxID=3095368 RepID=A0ACC6M4M7_9BACI|nr:helix-hairpin-helix domain-containing protein [Gracilibacillus sp. S3-1-1]MDX8045925.1 helix-hairpin-helix domain-containing protein [Gracilibacillus sp. S3-1-1]
MTWLIKNWYVVVIVGAIIIWLVVDPSVEKSDQTSVELDRMEEVEQETEEEIVIDATYKIDVKGEVKQPGVYQVSENDRVEDVIDLAGGFNEDADVEQINLAERVYDEMVIFIPGIGEEVEANLFENQDNQKVKVNTATVEEIQTIPGIGEVKANAIIEYRETNGRFKQMEDLTQVSGIGEKTVEKMEEYIQIP